MRPLCPTTLSRLDARRALASFLLVALATLCFAAPARADDVFADQKIEVREPARSTPGGETSASSGPSLTRVVVSLAGVAVLIVALGFVYRKMVAGQQAKGGAVTMLSRSILTPKHQVMVLRVGHRLVVVGDAGQGMQPLCEITDPAEMAAVVGAAGGDLEELQAGAFAASLDNASADYSAGYDPIPGGDDQPVEDAPAGSMFDDAGKEVQGLLDRVRGLTKQVQGQQTER